MKKTLLFAAALLSLCGCARVADAQILPRRLPILSEPAPPPPMLTPAALQADLNAKAGSDTVYFSANGSTLDPAALTTLRLQAAWLRANPFVAIRLEGHGDQNDTRDYALAMGERRAADVRDFLVSQGIAPGRILITSWGKERPGTLRIGPSIVSVGPRVVTKIR